MAPTETKIVTRVERLRESPPRSKALAGMMAVLG